MERNASIDAFRALGALLVFSFHTRFLIGKEFSTGWTGVSLFFVLSGYLIGGRLLALVDRDMALKPALASFYWRRVVRIFPVYVVFLLVVSAVALGTGDPALLGPLPYAWTYTSNFFHASAAYVFDPVMGPTWTLAVEEQFYLLFPFVVLLLGRRRLAPALLAMIIAGPALRAALAVVIDHWPQYFTDKHEAVYVAGFTHIDAFAFGALVNLMPESLRARLGRGPVILAATAIAIALGALSTGTLAGALWFSPGEAGAQLIWGYTAVDVVCMLLICRAVSRPADALGRATGAMAAIGQWSYSFYLIHLPIIFLVSRVRPTFGVDVPAWLGLIAAFAITLATARVLYEWVEKPALRLRARFDGARAPVSSA
jgi:peptidoglycan/LPS O-acetylase OafA/YrhL